MTGTALSKPITAIGDHYEVVVVGTGYGGGVSAARLARAGKQVAVLERGREIRPGEYPKYMSDARTEFQVATPHGRIGRADAMFDLHTNDDVYALVGCGLGGTSLINANVGLQVDPRIFGKKGWPAPFRDDPTLLDPYYALARRVLDISPYPDSYPPLNKLAALEEAAAALGARFERTPIAVNFADKVNPFGVHQPACTNCGDCCSGCNVGAKNTTLMNYLPDAVNHGAQIFAGGRVERVEPREGGGWKVHYTKIIDGTEAGDGVVEAEIVVLGAGTLGSSGILLRSRAAGLTLSGTLGEKFSGNGDVLAFGFDAYRSMDPVSTRADVEGIAKIYAIGVGANQVDPAVYPGPCITGVITVTGEDLGDSLIVQDGVAPGPMGQMITPAMFFADALLGGFTRFGAGQAQQRLLDAKALGTAVTSDLANIGEYAFKGSLARSQSYLVMSFDDDGGRLELDGKGMRIVWKGAGTTATIERDNAVIQDVCDAMAAQYFPNPLWTPAMGHKIITVHPLGGCCMADDAAHGVVDERCRVYSGTAGTAVHQGLYVCDGSVIPGGVGVNPLLTITAVSERAMALLLEDHGLTAAPFEGEARPAIPPLTAPVHPSAFASLRDWAVEHVREFTHDCEEVAGALLAGLEHDLSKLLEKLVRMLREEESDILHALMAEVLERYGHELSPTFSFTETMAGHLAFAFVEPTTPRAQRIASAFAVAESMGRAAGTDLSFRLTVSSPNLHDMLADPQHAATLTGTVTCPHLSPDPIAISNGVFRLLTVDPDTPEQWLMTYDMTLDHKDGPIRFHGQKVLHKRHGSNPWEDLTTLFVTLRDAAGNMLAKGVLTLGVDQLMAQMTTLAFGRQDNDLGRLLASYPRLASAIDTSFMGKVASLFATSIFQTYGGLLADLADFPAQQAASVPPPRKLDAPEPMAVHLRTPDDFSIRLTRYHGGDKGPVILAPGFSVKAWSFATPTVERNLVEYLCAGGYDVWLFDYRASGDAGNPTDPKNGLKPFTLDDIARFDWPTAIDYITKYTGAPSVQAMAHCVGSMSLLMGIASGAITRVRSIVSSQLSLHPVTDWMNYVKSDLEVAQLLSKIGGLHDAMEFSASQEGDGPEIDVLAYSMPVPAGQECHNPTCHRVFTTFGPSYDHAQLNQATHVALGGMFSTVPLDPFDQIQLIVEAGHAVDAQGKDIYCTPEGAERLRLPITFLAGTENQIFFPETTALTKAWLEASNPPEVHGKLYHRHVFSGYAHMDLFIGKSACRDIFPLIQEALDGCARA